jgi:hypothetical protein
MRHTAVCSGDDRVGWDEVRCVVVCTEHVWESVEEFLSAAAPCRAFDGIRRGAPDLRRDGSAAQQARPPESAVLTDLKAGIAGPSAQWQKRESGADDARERHRASPTHHPVDHRFTDSARAAVVIDRSWSSA